MDTIADMLSKIRNAQAVRQESVDVPFSKIKLEIARILLERGFVKEVKKIKKQGHKFIRIFLKYTSAKTPVISGLRRISKPGRRIYRKKEEFKKVKGGYGFAIVSTSKGVMTDEEARKNKVGGEVICEVW